METHGDRNRRRKGARANSSRATRLLAQLIDRQLATAEVVAGYVGISPQSFETYLTGEKRLPLESQRRLAQLIYTNVPELAREALRLKLQCDAEELYRSNDTQTHLIAPPSRFR